MINIAFVIDRLYGPQGGTEKQLLLLLKELDRKRFHPCLICLRHTDWVDAQNFDFPLTTYRVRSLFGYGFFIAIIQFVLFCRKNRIDIVQTFFDDSNVFGALAILFARTPVFIVSRRNTGHSNNKLILMAKRVFSRFTNCYLCNSRAAGDMAKRKEGAPGRKVVVIPNGLYLNEFRKITPELRAKCRQRLAVNGDQLLVGMVANLRPVKNLGLFVEVASRIHRVHPRVLFVVAGEGPEQARLQKKIEGLGLARVFSLLGPVVDIIGLLSALDMGVQCSRSESLSNTVIEYMAAGIPVLASDISGNREALGGKNGILFSNEDAHDFFAKLEQLIVDPDLRLRYGKRGRDFASKHYDHKVAVSRHEALYSQLLAGANRTSR